VSTFRSANGIRRAAPCTNGIPSKIAERERNRAAVLTAVSELCEAGDGVSYDQLQGHTASTRRPSCATFVICARQGSWR